MEGLAVGFDWVHITRVRVALSFVKFWGGDLLIETNRAENLDNIK